MKRFELYSKDELGYRAGVLSEENLDGQWVCFDEAERYGGSEYARGYANGSGDEGYYQREITRLKQELSLAEEGLANYAQENEGAKHDIERLMAACNEEANEVERLKAALERIKRIGYGLELHSDAEERAEYWSAMALEYRRIAAEALRPAEPQT